MKALLYSLMMTVLMLASGCSTLQTRVSNDVDWAAYRSVNVSVTEPDRWELRPLVAERLADWGFVPVEQDHQHVDLIATLEVTEGSSIAETGEEISRPKNLLLRLEDRYNGAELARSSYQLAATQSPRHGLTLMVNDLRKHTRKTRATPPQPTDHQIAITPAQKAPATSADATDLTEPPVPIAIPAQKELNEPEPTNSDWVPRFKGWQLWGDDTTAE